MSVRAETIPVGRPRPSLASRALRAVREHALAVFAVAVLVYLLLPIAVVVLFSFNDPAGRFNYTWSGFTFDNWTNIFSSRVSFRSSCSRLLSPQSTSFPPALPTDWRAPTSTPKAPTSGSRSPRARPSRR